MNPHVQYDAMPILVNMPRDLIAQVNEIVDTGYVLEAVSKVGIAATHVGYRYLVAGVEILLTEDAMYTPKSFFDFLSEIFAVKSNVLKRAMSVCCMSCRYEAFRAIILDDADRKRISEKAFSKLDLLSMLGYFVSHCVDRAEQNCAERQSRAKPGRETPRVAS